MLKSLIFLFVLLVAGILYYVFYQRKRASRSKPGVYVCHSCGEYDCVCHQKDQAGAK